MSQLIHLISGPRNISTAFMYSFGNRTDTAIVDEPFYGYYLSNFDVNHPGTTEVLESQNSDPMEVIENILMKSRDEQYLFVKNMAHHLDGFDYSYCYEAQNIFLIRDPKRLITSFAKVISQPTAADVGLQREAELYDEIVEKGKYRPIVIDSGELLKNPAKVIRELCDHLDIPQDNNMLSWKAGAREEDGSWAQHWYANVHKSTCFVPQNLNEIDIAPRLNPIYQEVLPYYEKLYSKAIKA